MNTNTCDYNTRNKQLCNFTIDCVNDNKPNQVHSPCPANEDTELLGCSQGNISMACPVMLCNYEKHITENNNIFKRNFPAEKMCIIPDYRGEYKVCDTYRDLAHKIKCQPPKKTDLNPGKSNGLGYLKNIDIDSELRIGYKATLCPAKKYNQEFCDKVVVTNPRLLDNPTCQNYKYYNYPENPQDYKTKCDLDMRNDDSNIRFNIKQCSETCNYNSVKSRLNKTQYDLQQPILFQQESDMPGNNRLQTGPERTNHRLENVWGNVTRRKHI